MQFWTITHVKIQLPLMALMVVAAWLLRRGLKNKEERVRMIPFQIVAAVIALLEIVKQLKSLATGYDFWHLPFHVCSVITVLLPLMAFYRGRYQQPLRGVTTAFIAGLIALMLIYPNGIYSDSALLGAFQTFAYFHMTLFHFLAVFAGVLIFALGLHEPQPRRDVKATLAVMLCYCVVAAVMANLLQINFHNFYRCILEPVEQLRLGFCAHLGAFWGQVLYVFLFSLVNLSGVLFCYVLYSLLCRARQYLSVQRKAPPTDEERIMTAAQGILEAHKAAFEELAK